MTDPSFIASELGRLYPDARCTLDFADSFQCLVAVSLSAQTTDKKVNAVTPALFKAYPDPVSLSKAKVEEVGEYIRCLGLWRGKAENLVALGEALVNRFSGKVPMTIGVNLAFENDDPGKVMEKLKRKFPRDSWIGLHHRFIAFGRGICHAQNPECGRCPFTSICRLFAKNAR